MIAMHCARALARNAVRNMQQIRIFLDSFMLIPDEPNGTAQPPPGVAADMSGDVQSASGRLIE